MEFLPNRNLSSNGARITFHESGLVSFNHLAALRLDLSLTQKYRIDVFEESIVFTKHDNGFPLRKNDDKNSCRFNCRALCREVIRSFGTKGITNISFLVTEKEENGFSLIINSKEVFKKEVSDEAS